MNGLVEALCWWEAWAPLKSGPVFQAATPESGNDDGRDGDLELVESRARGRRRHAGVGDCC